MCGGDARYTENSHCFRNTVWQSESRSVRLFKTASLEKLKIALQKSPLWLTTRFRNLQRKFISCVHPVDITLHTVLQPLQIISKVTKFENQEYLFHQSHFHFLLFILCYWKHDSIVSVFVSICISDCISVGISVMHRYSGFWPYPPIAIVYKAFSNYTIMISFVVFFRTRLLIREKEKEKT